MKTIKTFYNTLIIIVAIMLLQGCTKLLDQTPYDYPTLNTFWQTGKDAESGLAGCYVELRSQLLNGDAGMAYFTYGDFPTQVFGSGVWDQNPFQGHFEYYSGGGLSDYSGWYKTINSVNTLLEKVPAIPLNKFNANIKTATAERDKILGEAYFIRAYTYFYMARIWGTFPLMLKSISSASDAINDIPYSTNAQILDQSMLDLTEAAKRLQWGYTASNERAVRANKGSVYALIAHINMWRARLSQPVASAPAFIAKAEAACDSVINKGGYQLVDSTAYSSIFKGKSAEGIFEIEFSVANNEYFADGGFTSNFLAKPIIPNGRDNPIFQFSSDFLGLFNDQKDARNRAFFYNLGGNGTMCTKYTSITYPTADQLTWRTDDHLIIFRLADIILLRAEALTRLNRSADARIWLNKVRNRAGVGDYHGTDASLAHEVYVQMRKELFLEGHNLYDMVRTGEYATNPYYSLQRYMDEGYYWPVSVNLFLRNKYTQQTPYWSSRIAN